MLLKKKVLLLLQINYKMKNELYIKLLSEMDRMNGNGLLRLFLSSDEKKACNEMFKLGYIIKGKTEEKNSTLAYYITREGENYLN